LAETLQVPAFATNATRVAHRAEINPIIEERTRTRPSAHWIDVLNKAGVPCGPVYGIGEAFDDPQVRNQNIAIETPFDGRPVAVLASPIVFDGGESMPGLPPPALGEHTETVLREIGYDDDRLSALRANGVI
jgi:crotonobetainyl-CoA:carnitine CoA-transferase CaiB-like acyl-CoA transferase